MADDSQELERAIARGIRRYDLNNNLRNGMIESVEGLAWLTSWEWVAWGGLTFGGGAYLVERFGSGHEPWLFSYAVMCFLSALLSLACVFCWAACRLIFECVTDYRRATAEARASAAARHRENDTW